MMKKTATSVFVLLFPAILFLALLTLANKAKLAQAWSDLKLPVNPSALTYTAYLPFVAYQPTVEARVVWIPISDWCGNPPCSRVMLEHLINRAADAHFNIILFQARTTGDAYYTPGLEPWAYRLTSNLTRTLGQNPGWDPLAVALQTAHTRGMKLQANVSMYPDWECGRWFPPTNTIPVHPFWSLGAFPTSDSPYTTTWRVHALVNGVATFMSVDSNGAVPCNEYLWSSPGVQRVNEHNLSVIKDVATRYDIDGIHMEYARYPGPQYSPDPESEDGYKAARVTSPTLSFANWQRNHLSEWMTRIYTEVKLINPKIGLSASVWFTYRKTPAITFPTSEGYTDFYQDSHRWIHEGSLDAIAPTIYNATFNSDINKWKTLADDHVNAQGDRQVWLGIGALITPASGIINRIYYARNIGARGVALWSAGVLEENQYWDDLLDGPFSDVALVP